MPSIWFCYHTLSPYSYNFPVDFHFDLTAPQRMNCVCMLCALPIVVFVYVCLYVYRNQLLLFIIHDPIASYFSWLLWQTPLHWHVHSIIIIIILCHFPICFFLFFFFFLLNFTSEVGTRYNDGHSNNIHRKEERKKHLFEPNDF